MFEVFTQDNAMLNTQFFMMKYGVFMIAGIVGCIASVGNGQTYPSVKDFIKHLVMTIALSIVAGILLSNFWDISLEVCFAIVVLFSFFIKKVIIELTEILDNLSDIAKSFIFKRINLPNNTNSNEKTNTTSENTEVVEDTATSTESIEK